MQRFLSSVCEEAYKRGHCPVMWSTPGGHYDREAFRLCDQELQKKLYAIGGKPYQPRETMPAQTTEPPAGTTAAPETETATAPEPEPETTPAQTSEPAASGKAGDIDGNGEVNVADAVLLARFCAEDQEISVSAAGKANADVNGDSDVTSEDLTVILEFLAGIRPTI